MEAPHSKRRRVEEENGIYVCCPGWVPSEITNYSEDEDKLTQHSDAGLIMTLPDELRLRILSMLGIRDLLILAQVSHAWRQLAEDRTLRPVFDFCSSDKENTRGLKALWHLFKHRVKYQVSALTFDGVVFNRSIHNFLQGQHSLTSLCLSRCTKMNDAIWGAIVSSCGDSLTHLDAANATDFGFDALVDLLKGTSSLTHLNVSARWQGYYLKNLFGSVAQHAPQLERLDCVFRNFSSVFSPPEIEKEKEDTTIHVSRFGAACVRLHTLSILAGPLLGPVLTHCCHLRELRVVLSTMHREEAEGSLYTALASPHPLLAERLVSLSLLFAEDAVVSEGGLALGSIGSSYPSLERLRVLPYYWEERKGGQPFQPVLSLPQSELRRVFTARLRVLEVESFLVKEGQEGIFGDDMLDYIGENSPLLETLRVGRTTITQQGLNKFFDRVLHIKAIHIETDEMDELVCTTHDDDEEEEDGRKRLEELEWLCIQSCSALRRVRVCCKSLGEFIMRDCTGMEDVSVEGRVMERCALLRVSHTQSSSIESYKPTRVNIWGGESVELQECEVGRLYVESKRLKELRLLRCVVIGDETPSCSILHPTLRVLDVDITKAGEKEEKDGGYVLDMLHVECPAMAKFNISTTTLKGLKGITLRNMEGISTTALELLLAQKSRDGTLLHKEIIGCGGWVDWNAVD